MLMLTNPGTADLIDLITSAAVNVDAHVSHMDMSTADPPVVKGSTSGRTNTAITTATTTTICAGPASGALRNVKTIHIRNKDASNPVDVTVRLNINGGTTVELFKATLNAGCHLEYIEGIGFFVVAPAAALDAKLRVSTDVINATTSFADITGLTCPVQAGKQYCFEAHLYHIGNATTTGAQFGINGPSMTAMRISQIDTTLGSLTVPTFATPTGDVAALDTAAAAETTGAATVVLGILSGWFNPSAAGTFAVRLKSEVAVAAGLTVKAGSWCRVWEAQN